MHSLIQSESRTFAWTSHGRSPHSHLVVVPLLLSVFVGLASFCIPAIVFSLLLGTSFPLVGPSALLVCGLCCYFASLSTPATVAGRYAATTLTFLITLCLLVFAWVAVYRGSNEQPTFGSGGATFLEFPWFIYVGLAALGAIAIALSVLGVQRRRCGESIWAFVKIPSFGLFSYRRVTEGGHRGSSQDFFRKPFRNQWSAHCWYEFQMARRWLRLPVFLVPLVLIAFLSVANYFDPSPSDTVYTVVVSLILCPIGYQVLAASASPMYTSGDRIGENSLAVFDATRPIRCDHLVAIKLLVAAGWSLAGWMIIACASFVYLRFFNDWEAVRQAAETFVVPACEVFGDWWVAATIGGLLVLISSAMAILMFQYVLLFMIIAGMFAFVPALLVWTGIISVESWHNLSTTLSYILAIGVMVISGYTVKTSLSSGFVGKPYFAASLAIWSAFVCTTLMLALKFSPAIPASAYWIITATLLVPIASITAAPPTLAFYRHG